MSSYDVDKGLMAYLSDSGILAGHVAGGVWKDAAPPEHSSYPYGVFENLGRTETQTSTGCNDTGQEYIIETVTYQVDLSFHVQGSSDTAGTLLNTLKPLLDNAPLVVAGNPCIRCRVIDDQTMDGNGDTAAAMISLEIMVDELVRTSPA